MNFAHFLIGLFFVTEFGELLTGSELRSFVRDVACTSRPSVCGLSFLVDSTCPRAEVLNFDEAQLVSILFCGSCFGVISKNSSPNPSSCRLSLVFCFIFIVYTTAGVPVYPLLCPHCPPPLPRCHHTDVRVWLTRACSWANPSPSFLPFPSPLPSAGLCFHSVRQSILFTGLHVSVRSYGTCLLILSYVFF